MRLWGDFRGWLGTKFFGYGLSILKKVALDNGRHPEENKARDAIKANADAQALRTNNDLVASYVKSVKTGVIGTGLTLQYKSPDEELNVKVENFLEYWSEYGNCERTKRFYRQKMERFLAGEAVVTGGFIVRNHWDKKNPLLYAMEVLSISTIDRAKNDFAKGLFYGIQTNSKAQISGIWIYKDDNRQDSALNSIDKLIFFVDIWTDPHQYTPVTPLAPILNTLDEMASYATSEIRNAKRRADKSVIIATEAYDIMLKLQESKIKSFNQDTQERKLAENEYAELLSSLSGGTLHDAATPIMPGDNTKVWDLQTTGNTVYADITENSKRIISRGLGLSPSTIAGLQERSYNTALKSAQEDEAEYAIIAQDLVEIVFKTTYRNAIEAGYLLGFYNIKNYYTEKVKYDRYLKITRKQKGHIDPLKQALGDAAKVEAGHESDIQVISNQGRDFLDVINDEVTYELAKKKAYEDAKLVYIQKGTENIALAEAKEEAKEEAKKQDIEESKTNIEER